MLTAERTKQDEPSRLTHSLSIVIPALNEEEGIRDIVERILRMESEIHSAGMMRVEILVVDDGSADGTAGVVRHIPGVRLVSHGENQGYGAAIKTGFAMAEGDWLAFLDADGTYPPESLPELCRVALEEDADVVVGSRRSGGASEMPVMRRIGNLLWANLVSLLGECRCADPASGMRLVRRGALRQIYPLPDGLNFTPVMSTRCVHESLKVIEIPIAYRERIGRSKLSIVRDGLRFLRTILWTTLEYSPARMLGMAGVSLLTLGLLLGLGVIGNRIAGVTTLGPWGVWSVFTTLVLLVAGLSVYSMGVTFHLLIGKVTCRPARLGLFRGHTLERIIEPHFGWLGLVIIATGGAVSGVSLFGGGGEWDIARIWLWLLGGALCFLTGTQMVILWLVGRVMDRLSDRPSRIEADLGRSDAEAGTTVRAMGAAAGAR
jgi:hypothetical protein